jgi:hypothetical protein
MGEKGRNVKGRRLLTGHQKCKGKENADRLPEM